MTSLTDKMEGLRRKNTNQMSPSEIAEDALKFKRHPNPAFNDGFDTGFNTAITASVALAKAEAVVVGDWEAEFDKRFLLLSHIRDKAGNTSIHSVEKINIKTFITTLLTTEHEEGACNPKHHQPCRRA